MKGTVAVGGMALSQAYLVIDRKTDVSAYRVEKTDEELQRLQAAAARCAKEITIRGKGVSKLRF